MEICLLTFSNCLTFYQLSTELQRHTVNWWLSPGFHRSFTCYLLTNKKSIANEKVSHEQWIVGTKWNAWLKFTIQFEMQFSSRMDFTFSIFHVFISCEIVPVLSQHSRLAHDKVDWKKHICKESRKIANNIWKYGPTMCLLIAIGIVIDI